jgi:hypothetical protein
MVRIVRYGNITISVFAEVGGRHHVPHCHVQWPDGRCSIAIDGFVVLAGVQPPRVVWNLLRQYESSIIQAWNELNETGTRQ